METHAESIAAILNALAGWRLNEYQKRSHTRPVHFLDASLHASRIDRGTLDCLLDVTWSNVKVGRKAAKLHFSSADVSFYNYPYLFGYLFSKGVYAQREQRGEAFYNDYVKLLRATGSMSAEELAREHLQVDLAEPDFWQASIDIASAQIDAFERLLREEQT